MEPVETPPEVKETEELEEKLVETPVEEPVLDTEGDVITDPEKAIHFKKEHEPPPESKRFKKVYWEAEEGKRQVSELNDKLKAQAEGMEELRRHHAELSKTLKPEPSQMTDKQQLVTLRAAKKVALSDVDYEKAFGIGDQIDDLILKIAQNPEEIQRVVNQTANDADLAEFVKNADWFSPELSPGVENPNYDPVKAGAAKEVELALGRKGKYKNQRELLAAVNKTLDERFSNKPPPPPPIPGVAGVASKETPSTSTVTLSTEQRRVVKMMFPDNPDGEKDYIEQLRVMGRI